MTAKDNTGTKRPLIILTGPTAVGKTALSIGLAKAIQGEIISADSMQGLGYKEIIDALQGSCSFEEAFERIKRETRHFAKRQFTWFRRERDVTWIDKETYENEDAILQYMIEDLKNAHILPADQ